MKQSQSSRTTRFTVRQGLSRTPIAHAMVLALLSQGVWASERLAQIETDPLQRPNLVEYYQTQSGVIDLPLNIFAREVLQVDPEIRMRLLQQNLAQEAVTIAEGEFQPQINLGMQQNTTKEKNSPEQDVLRSGADYNAAEDFSIYERESLDLVFGYSQKISSGAVIEGDITLSQFDSNVAQQRRGFAQDDYQVRYNIGITQPLMRDAWSEVSRSKVAMAQLDTAIVDAMRDQSATTQLADALASYYDLALAQDRLALWISGEQKTRELLEEAQVLQAIGRLSQADVLDVEGSLLRYQAGLSEARQQLQEQMHQLRRQLFLDGGKGVRIRAQDGLPSVRKPTISVADSVQVALENRTDFRAERIRIEREGVQVSYAKNQTKPRLDLIASYGMNNVDTSAGVLTDFGDASKYSTWKLGVSFEMALGADKRANAEFRSAQLRQDDAVLNQQQLEQTITVEIENSLSALENSFLRWEMFRKAADIEIRQLQTEREKLNAGRSDMRTILAREERLINARNAELEQAATYAKAQVALDMAQGLLLSRYQ